MNGTTLSWPHWRDAVGDPRWTWRHFSPQEMASGGGGALAVDPAFMDRLELLRTMMQGPLRISSGYRTPEYNQAIAHTGPAGPHTTGRAADILVAGADARLLVFHAVELGFTGIGIKQHGQNASRFVHVDTLEPPEFPRPMIWTYQ